MTIPTRAALALAIAASAATLPMSGVANAACPPAVNPQVCQIVTDPVPDRCYYYPDNGTIRCYWDD